MTAFSRRLPGCCRNFFSVRRMDDPRRMKDGSVHRMIFSPLHLRRCCHSFCAVRKTACPRMTGDPHQRKDGHRMTFSRLRHSCCCRSFCAVRRTVCRRRTDGSVPRMKFFSLRLRRCHRSFCAGHSHRCGLHSFCGLMNILLFRYRRDSDSHRAGRSRRCDCRWSNSCDCRKTCTLRQRRMKRQALPSFSALVSCLLMNNLSLILLQRNPYAPRGSLDHHSNFLP